MTQSDKQELGGDYKKMITYNEFVKRLMVCFEPHDKAFEHPDGWMDALANECKTWDYKGIKEVVDKWSNRVPFTIVTFGEIANKYKQKYESPPPNKGAEK